MPNTLPSLGRSCGCQAPRGEGFGLARSPPEPRGGCSSRGAPVRFSPAALSGTRCFQLSIAASSASHTAWRPAPAGRQHIRASRAWADPRSTASEARLIRLLLGEQKTPPGRRLPTPSRRFPQGNPARQLVPLNFLPLLGLACHTSPHRLHPDEWKQRNKPH